MDGFVRSWRAVHRGLYGASGFGLNGLGKQCGMHQRLGSRQRRLGGWELRRRGDSGFGGGVAGADLPDGPTGAASLAGGRESRCQLRLGGSFRGGLQGCAGFLIAEKLLVILAGDGGAHPGHPDGQRGFGAGLLFAQRLAAVKAHPDAAGDRGRKAQEPGVGVVAGGAGFAAQGVLELRGGRAGAVRGDGLQQDHHGAGGLLAR